MQKISHSGIKRLRNTAILIIAAAAISLSGGCWLDIQKGVFMDSVVSGLNYQTEGYNGITESDGSFYYKIDGTVSFSIGDLALGSTIGEEIVTPLSITEGATTAADQRVTNKLILLQTIDYDGDLNNGIQITKEIAAIVSANAASINFDQTPAAFIAGISVSGTGLIAQLNSASVFSDKSYRGARLARTVSDALIHFNRSTGVTNIVHTTNGDLRGFEANSNTWQYFGVRYAKSPVGNLRWKAPQRLERWHGVHDAIEYGNQSAQLSSYVAAGSGGASEDCLNLNITAPKDAKNLPVMVWFHGGAFGILSSNTSAYNNPAALTTKGVVLVTVNARLGAFGYLAHPLLTAESRYGGSGNYGQMDLIEALKWVKGNIKNFGGDPKNVTIFGQSGGGGKAISLMASPLAKGLFNKVICQSGIAVKSNPILNHSSLAAAEASGTDLFSRLGVTTLEQARAVPASSIIMSDVIKDSVNFWLFYKPNIDNYYLTDTMENIIKGGLPCDVPFLAGSNAFDIVAGADLAPGITEQMPWRSAYNKAKQFVYFWSFVPKGWDAMNVGAYHGLELIYVFNSSIPSFVMHYNFGLVLNKTTGLKPVIPVIFGNSTLDLLYSTGYYSSVYPAQIPSAESVRITDDVMTVWTNFAKYSDPSASGIIDSWPEYNTDTNKFVEIGKGGLFTIVDTGLEGSFGTP